MMSTPKPLHDTSADRSTKPPIRQHADLWACAYVESL